MKRSLPARVARWAAIAILVAAVGSIMIVAAFRWLPVPVTAFMVEEKFATWGAEPALEQKHDWVPWPQISRHAAIAVIAAEDQKFLLHDGFDFDQIGKAVSEAQRGRRLRGASTISQQVAKNLFLWSGQSWIRKGLEVWFTLWIECLWTKERILEVYLNVAEFGPGIYGVQAAAQEFFAKNAEDLSPLETSRLIAVLPNPRKWSARHPGPFVQTRVDWIMVQIGHGPPALEVPEGTEPLPPGEMPEEIPAEPGLESEPGLEPGGETGEPAEPGNEVPVEAPASGEPSPDRGAETMPPPGEAPPAQEPVTPPVEEPAPESPPPTP